MKTKKQLSKKAKVRKEKAVLKAFAYKEDFRPALLNEERNDRLNLWYFGELDSIGMVHGAHLSKPTPFPAHPPTQEGDIAFIVMCLPIDITPLIWRS